MLSKKHLFLKYLGQTSDSPCSLEIDYAEGIYLYGIRGEKYIDIISGVSVSNLGHGNELVKDAVKKQIDKHTHLMVYGEYVQSPQVDLAVYLSGILPDSLNSVYFVNSGSEAVDTALKLAKRHTRKHKIISFKNAYHGSTHGAISVTGQESFKNSFRPLLPEIYHLDFNSIEQLNEIDNSTACVIVEPVQAEAGIIVAHEQFMHKLRQKCTDTGTLLIFDEIQTGFGRTGKMFGFQHFGIVPDIICFAKALGAGMPIGAIVSSKEIMDSFKSNPILGHITTFGGHPVSCAAALAGLKYLNNSELITDSVRKANIFIDCLRSDKIVEIRHKGLFMAVDLGDFNLVMSFIKAAIKNGLVTDWFLFYDKAFRIAPPLTITDEEIIIACKIINKTLKEI